jgi:hypothetical protein
MNLVGRTSYWHTVCGEVEVIESMQNEPKKSETGIPRWKMEMCACSELTAHGVCMYCIMDMFGDETKHEETRPDETR